MQQAFSSCYKLPTYIFSLIAGTLFKEGDRKRNRQPLQGYSCLECNAPTLCLQHIIVLMEQLIPFPDYKTFLDF